MPEKLEASEKSLPELLSLSTIDLSNQFDLKRGHIARFIDRTRSGESSLKLRVSARKRTSMIYRDESIPKSVASTSSYIVIRSHVRSNATPDRSPEKSMSDLKIKDG